MGQCFSSTGGEPVERAGPAPAAGGQVQAESTDRIQKKEADAAMALLQGDVPAEAATWVQVFVSANRLLRKDIMSESDPLAVVYYYDDAGGTSCPSPTPWRWSTTTTTRAAAVGGRRAARR